MELNHKLEQIFNNDYPGTERFVADVIVQVFGNEIEYVNDDLAEREEYADRARKAGIKHIKYVGNLTEQNYNADNIVLLDVTVEDSKNIERSRVNIQQLIRSIVQEHQHMLIVFHYENVIGAPWRFSYAYKADTVADTTSAKRYTYVFGRDYRGRTAAQRFEVLAESQRNNADFQTAFSVEALSDKFFKEYREHYADFVQYITGKRYEKEKNKWVEKYKHAPNTEIFPQFNNDDKRVRDYIKKMLGRLIFLCFLQRKGWMNNDSNFLHNLYQTSSIQNDFLDAVLEPLFFGVLNSPPENRKEVFAKNGWRIEFAEEWKDIPYLNGGLFEQTKEDKLNVKFPKKLFQELFEFFGEYNFTIDENDPDDAEIGIDPEMLGRVFESLLEDNKSNGAFYTPKEIVQYMCRQCIIEYLKRHTAETLHSDIEDLINNGWVNHALQSKDNARAIYKLLKDVTICDPAIGSGAFAMGVLNIIFTARQHLYGFLNDSAAFNPLEIKKSIIRDNIYGVDIEQGAVDIARLRFWLAILLEERVATPLPNLDYRIVRGNSLITTFNDEYIHLPEIPDGRTKIAKLKNELHNLQNELFNRNGDDKLQCEIDIKCKILEIIKIQLGIDRQTARDSKIEPVFFDEKTTSRMAQKKAREARAMEEIKSESLFTLNTLLTSLTTPAIPLADRAQIDIKFFGWDILFSNIFGENNRGFDIVIGNPPYVEFKNYSKEDKAKLKNFLTTKGKYDLYIPFVEQGSYLLKDHGILSYICPTRFMKRDYGKALREYIVNNLTICSIIDFSDIQIFENAMTYTGVFEFCKEKTHSGYTFKYGNNLSSEGRIVGSDKLLNGAWEFNPGKIENLIAKIRGCHPKLEEICAGIIQGIATGKDSVFVVSKPIIKSYNIEPGILRPFIKGKDISTYKINWSGLYVIYPYDKDGKVMAEFDFKQFYPNAYSYLVEKREELKGRSYFDKSTKLWYELWNQRKPSRFEGEKIVTLDNASRNSFCIDNDNFYGTTTVYNIKLSDERFSTPYVVGVLNSKILNFYHHATSIPQANGFYRYQAIFIKGMPIPVPSDDSRNKIHELVKQIKDTATNGKQLSEIDHIVYHLYGLTYDEVLIVDPDTPITREEYDNFKLE